jgi:hypothetical protein
MPPSILAYAHGQSGNPAIPAHVAGHRLRVALLHDGTDIPPTIVGWTLIGDVHTSTNRLYVYERVGDGSVANLYAAYSGPDAWISLVSNDAGIVASDSGHGTSSTPVFADVTPGVASTLLIDTLIFAGEVESVEMPDGELETVVVLHAHGGGMRIGVKAIAGDGATGTRTGTLPGVDGWASKTFAVVA